MKIGGKSRVGSFKLGKRPVIYIFLTVILLC
jgi:hypothetical protein